MTSNNPSIQQSSNSSGGQMKNDAALWDRLLYILEWTLAIKLRHAEQLDFSMVYIKFDDKGKLGNLYGAMGAAQMLFKLTHELNDAMRKTDVVARSGSNFWVLIPHHEAESVVSKVAKIVEIAGKNGLDAVDCDISIFPLLNNEILKQGGLDSPLLFLDYVKSHCSVAKSWSAVNN